MTTLVACPVPILQFFDNAGNPAVGGTVLTQVGGVNYPTYADVNGTTTLPNPIPLNSRGEVSTAAGASAQCFLEQGVAYTFTLYDAAGNQLNQATYVSNTEGTAQEYFYGGLDSGTANAYVLTSVGSISSLSNGYLVSFIPAHANTGASTVNVNSLGTVSILNQNGTALTAGQIAAGAPAEIIYYSGNWYLLNPTIGQGSYGTFSATLGTAAVTISYSTVGRLVSLTFPPASLGNPTLGNQILLTGVPTALLPATTKFIPASGDWLAGSGGSNVANPVALTLSTSASYFQAYPDTAFPSGYAVQLQSALCVTYSLD